MKTCVRDDAARRRSAATATTTDRRGEPVAHGSKIGREARGVNNLDNQRCAERRKPAAPIVAMNDGGFLLRNAVALTLRRTIATRDAPEGLRPHAGDHGQHATARMYATQQGGTAVDGPGCGDYAPKPTSRSKVRASAISGTTAPTPGVGKTYTAAVTGTSTI